HGDAPDVQNGLAYLYAEHQPEPGRLEEARKLAESSIKAQPENPSFLDTAGWVHFKRGEMDEAWHYLEQAMRLDPASGVYALHAAQVARARGEGPRAQALLDQALTRPLEPRLRQLAEDLVGQWRT
ncbi:MAG: hypothetical protein AB1634_18665, partial [Thermodesulfobacteriota bacterium]